MRTGERKMMIEIDSGWIEDLMACKRKVEDRDFRKHTIEQLMKEAIFEFNNRYAKK